MTSGQPAVSEGQTNAWLQPRGGRYESCARITCTEARNKIKLFVIQKVDTNVIVILAGVFFELIANQTLADIWVAFSTSNNF